MPADTYTKRVVRQQNTGILLAGRTDGDIWVAEDNDFRRLTNLGSAIRDVAVTPDESVLFAATEDGRVVKLNLKTGDILNTFQTEGHPFAKAVWALAYNPVRRILAFAEFGQNLHLISSDDFKPLRQIECQRVKRIRWTDPGLLMFGSSDEIHRYDYDNDALSKVVTQMQNTVEDFIWDADRRYLLAVCYQCTVGLFDFNSGEKLDAIRDQIEYPKGLAWLDASHDPRAYPLDFITWGRSGSCHQYRIHNERIVALGPLADGEDNTRLNVMFEKAPLFADA